MSEREKSYSSGKAENTGAIVKFVEVFG